jgi:hypothetical protein
MIPSRASRFQLIDFVYEKLQAPVAAPSGGHSRHVGPKCERALTHKVIHNPL